MAKQSGRPTKPGGTAPTSARTMGNKVSGGIGSRNVNPQGVRNGAPARGINPAAVAQLGGVYGDHATDHTKVLPYRGESYLVGKTPAGGGAVPLGNQLATNVGKGGCGTGREVMARGSQSTYGSPAPGNPQPKGELFPGWPATKR